MKDRIFVSYEKNVVCTEDMYNQGGAMSGEQPLIMKGDRCVADISKINYGVVKVRKEQSEEWHTIYRQEYRSLFKEK